VTIPTRKDAVVTGNERVDRRRGDERHARRLTKRVVLGAVLGGVVGAAIGVGAASLTFESAGPIAACGIAGAIAGAMFGTFTGGMTALESPDPGREPTEVDRPIVDVPELTDVEHTQGGEREGGREPDDD
jgi:hypothetical protein